MNRWETGMLAKSLAGHDKNKVYVIAGIDETYVYLVDGNIRTSEKMKKKKKIHVQIIKEIIDMNLADDASIRNALEEYACRIEGGKKHV